MILAFAALFALFASPSSFSGVVEAATFTEIRDLEYDKIDGESLKLDLFLPAGSAQGLRPAVVLIHGGCFSGGDKSENTSEAEDLAGRGFVAAAINYRLAPRFHYPAAITDARQAVRFLRKSAKRFQIDPSRVASFGQSAGGYLAARLGVEELPDRSGKLDAFSARVAIVGDHYGRTDFTLSQGTSGTDCAVIFLGTTREKNPDLFKEASIMTHVDSRSSPFFIAQGTADPQVHPIQSNELHKALDQARVPNQLFWVQGTGHGFSGNDFKRAWNATLKFFNNFI